MKATCCKRCGGELVDRVAPRSGNQLRYCPRCHLAAKRLARSVKPEKDRARSKVYLAVKAGKLVRRPCEVCGNPQSEAHHIDYANALQVQWLCRLHHRRLHASLRKAGAKSP